jgi:demethylmenaquinone methyltransferase/2-methoxy-6-polyprenyl-1,4-benzoquinol methylase
LPEFTHEGQNKKEFVQKMFDDISPHYDFLNHLLSLGTDIYWRKKFIQKLNIADQTKILDVACGTGDICFEILRHYNVSITGLDISQNMINIANKKAKKKKQENVTFIKGEGENLPLDSNSVDYLTISYGFRNISNYEAALQEFFRVLKPGGTLGILEFSKPKYKIIGFIFRLYFHHILPRIGSLFSRSDAYRYLPESVDFFPTRDDICRKIIHSGFQNANIYDLTFGISTIFLGFKSDE